MGTTQRIIPGVTGEPNWGDLSRSITGVAKTVEKKSETDREVDKTPEEIRKDEKQYKNIIDRRNKLEKTVKLTTHFQFKLTTSFGAK